MSEKLRVDGMTIDSTKIYPENVVLRLLHTSFDNGCRHEIVRAEKEFQRGYKLGYSHGRESASKTLMKLQEALRDILNCEAVIDEFEE